MTTAETKASNKTYHGIQALRAIAALLVVIQHAITLWRVHMIGGPHQAQAWPNGQAGVDIFFVISGFVMAITAPSLPEQRNRAWTFLRRRFLRIIPLYWFFTTVKVLLLKVSPSLGHESAGTPWHIIASYLFIPALNDHGLAFLVVVAGWTLNYEMLFYFLFAIALALEIPLLAFLIPTLAAVAGAGFLNHASWPAFTALVSPLVLEFLFGVVLGHLTLRGQLPGGVAATLLFVGGFAAVLTLPQPAENWRWVFWGVPPAAVVTSVVALEDKIGRMWPRWLLEAGNASYLIYLYHAFILPAVGLVLVRLHRTKWPETVLLALALSLLMGEVIHHWIEVPLTNAFRRKPMRGVTALPA